MSDIFELFKKISRKKSSPVPPTHILVGLGNPGDKYTLTRHNAGFMALEYIARQQGVTLNRLKFRSLTERAEISGVNTILLAPQTYMNLSGEAVRECADFYKIPPENIIVLSDDLSFEVGRLRVRQKGSDGGHNGLSNIIYQLNSDAFPRIRIGIGTPPHPDFKTTDWVLSEFTQDEKKILFDSFESILRGVEMILAGDIDGAMQLCNSRHKS